MPAAARQAVVDCHTHFGDPARPKGIVRTTLPPAFKQLATPVGVTGTVICESTTNYDSDGEPFAAEDCRLAGNDENR
eukprot:SAG22_NODE_390_length_11235_cov_26.293732_3_plen_77_part_00